MTYDDYWRVAIFVDGHKQTEPYPQSFWFNPHRELYSQMRTPIDYRFSKSTKFALNLHSMRCALNNRAARHSPRPLPYRH